MAQPTKLVACLGDSITAGSDKAATPYPIRLQQLLGNTYAVIQSGIGGDRLAAMNTRWGDDIKTRAGSNITGTKTLVLMGGINDVIDGTAAATIVTAIKLILDDAGAAGWEVICLSLAPFGDYSGWDAAKQTVLESVNSSMASYVPSPSYTYTYVNVYDDLEDPTNADTLADSTPDYATAEYSGGPSADGLHINDSGSQVIAAAVQAAI